MNPNRKGLFPRRSLHPPEATSMPKRACYRTKTPPRTMATTGEINDLEHSSPTRSKRCATRWARIHCVLGVEVVDALCRKCTRQDQTCWDRYRRNSVMGWCYAGMHGDGAREIDLANPFCFEDWLGDSVQELQHCGGFERLAWRQRWRDGTWGYILQHRNLLYSSHRHA